MTDKQKQNIDAILKEKGFPKYAACHPKNLDEFKNVFSNWNIPVYKNEYIPIDEFIISWHPIKL